MTAPTATVRMHTTGVLAGDLCVWGAVTVKASDRVVRALLDRRTVLCVIVLIALTTAVGLVLPQDRASLDAEAGAFAVSLGLNHLFTGWWFRVITLISAVQLSLVMVRLARRDLRRIRRTRGPASRGSFCVRDADGLRRALRRVHYVRMRTSPAVERYVKNVWGYLGPVLLHLGMLLAIVSILITSLTVSSGVLTLAEGATVSSATTMEDVRRGPLASSTLPSWALRLDDITIDYWPNGEPRRIAGTYSVIKPGTSTTVIASTNEPVIIDGVRIFQDSRVGYGYALTLTQGDIVMTPRLTLPLPGSADEAAYADVRLENGDVLRAKVVHDPDVPDGAPVLTLRLVRDDRVVDEQRFAGTGAAILGDTSVSVDAATRWSVVALQHNYGMTPLFGSFFVILLGATLIYAAAPRELTLMKHEDGMVTADWHAVRFATLYESEERALREASIGMKERISD